ncbi:hypothetical protein ACKA06_10655 [Rossellomorea oryzaecorticis]|jgi:hypothetical protein|uniref:Uncharacterized protein n=2 Tax=Rossellomorea TaxID=2837508 RepID=A0A1J6WYA5_9BACI|nr:hypothetical protein [Rossellomorea aquimaris]OIU73147.1 hypothetical protein BHE18_14805 [Rossellomorea aquimaris]
MEMEKGRAESNRKKVYQRYLLPLTITSSMLVSGLIGYTASRIAVKNNVGNTTDISNLDNMENQINEARDHSLKVIEKELPKIISDLEKYNKDINLLVKNVKWLNDNLAPIREATNKFDTAITVAKGVNTVVKFPVVGDITTKLASAQIQLDEIDRILIRLENLTVIQQEMSDSHHKINVLYEKYQKDKSMETLMQIEQEVNSNLIYQIEDLKNTTIEAHKVLELSSSVLITVNKTKSLLHSMQEMGENTLDVIQFWKETEDSSGIGANESLEKDLNASIEKIQKLPNELSQRSKSTITSIENVQKELQTVKIAEMVSGE